MPGMPKVDENHQRLERLAGSWVAEEQLSPSPWGAGGTATGRVEARMALDGFFLLTDYQQEREGRVTFRGHSVHGWDPQRKVVVWYWVDSMGLPPPAPATGRWEGDALVMTQATPMGQSRYSWRLDGDGSYRFAIESSPDGEKWQLFTEGQYRPA